MTFFSRVGANLDLMQEMFRQTGALDKALSGNIAVACSNASSLRQAVHRCASCDSVAACQRWLELGHEEALHDRTPPAFCPNSALQTQLKRIG